MSNEEYGPSPLLKFIEVYKKGYSQGAKDCLEAVKKALLKKSEIPLECTPQDMNDGLQRLLMCGKYENVKYVWKEGESKRILARRVINGEDN